MHEILDVLLHPAEPLKNGIVSFGPSIYLIMWLIVFCETGLIIFPFLPGDSLLFASGMFCNPALWAKESSQGTWHPNLWLVMVAYFTAAIVGDSTNFFIGRKLGIKLFKDNSKLFKKKHLEHTHAFFDHHGAKAIVIGRFVPIVRTLVPFVAGLQTMSYKRFVTLSIIGSFFWVTICCGAGYLLASVIKPEAFDKTILAVVFVTVLIAALETWNTKRKHQKAQMSKAANATEPEQV